MAPSSKNVAFATAEKNVDLGDEDDSDVSVLEAAAKSTTPNTVADEEPRRLQRPVLRIQKRDVCIVGVARTPIGALFGSLASFSEVELGACAIQGALQKARVAPSLVEEVYMGNVLSMVPDPARRAALSSGLLTSTSCTTVSQAGSSGMRAIMCAVQSIKLCLSDVAVAGGMESMSNACQERMEGHDIPTWLCQSVYDMSDIEAHSKLCTLPQKKIEMYATDCLQRGRDALKNSTFSWETKPVTKVKPSGSGSVTPVYHDQGHFQSRCAKPMDIWYNIGDGVGPMTAAGDGAAALVLVSGAKSKELNLQVYALILGYAVVAGGEHPEEAIKKALIRAKLRLSQIEYFEICETFPARALETQRKVKLDEGKANVHGGAAFLRHPLGCSGARAVVTLLGVLIEKAARYGVAAVYGAGEGTSALVIERR